MRREFYLKINGVKLLSVPKAIQDVYRETVKGNENTSSLDIRKKLTRNVLLANEVEVESLRDKVFGVRKYTYGNLHITTWMNMVLDVENHNGGYHFKSWKKDHKKYDKLTKLLEIEQS